jgi:hypothetical protein
LANLNGSKIKRGALPYFFTHVIERWQTGSRVQRPVFKKIYNR